MSGRRRLAIVAALASLISACSTTELPSPSLASPSVAASPRTPATATPSPAGRLPEALPKVVGGLEMMYNVELPLAKGPHWMPAGVIGVIGRTAPAASSIFGRGFHLVGGKRPPEGTDPPFDVSVEAFRAVGSDAVHLISMTAGAWMDATILDNHPQGHRESRPIAGRDVVVLSRKDTASEEYLMASPGWMIVLSTNDQDLVAEFITKIP